MRKVLFYLILLFCITGTPLWSAPQTLDQLKKVIIDKLNGNFQTTLIIAVFAILILLQMLVQRYNKKLMNKDKK